MVHKKTKTNRRSIRLQGYDYGQQGAYFITITTCRGEHSLGRIYQGKMHLSTCGRSVKEELVRTGLLRRHVRLDEFIVMPNHVHAIIWIDEFHETGTARRAPTVERFGSPVSGTIPTIVRSFKAAATRRVNEINHTSGRSLWQRGYFEHVIRDEESLHRIRDYIRSNPATWMNDVENPNRSGTDAFHQWLSTLPSRS